MMTAIPGTTWATLQAGNSRFVGGVPQHPNQNASRRSEVAWAQTPMATLFGCSDSRLAAEIIFDLGLGDLFVVRNMGHIMSPSVLASLEYAVEFLHVPLIVVLAHDSCGAVTAAIQAARTDPPALPAAIDVALQQIVASAKRMKEDAGLPPESDPDPHAVGRAHLHATVSALLTESELISQKIADRSLAIIGATYTLKDGAVSADVIVGDLSHE
jgi:carbonic anhydrase